MEKNLSGKVYPSGSKPQVTLEWDDVDESQPISIYDYEGCNPFLIQRIWEEIKPFLMDMIFEGDNIQIIHHFTLENVDSKEISEYFEIKIATPHCGEGLSDGFILDWYCKVISFLKQTLMKLNIPFDERTSENQQALQNLILHFMACSKESRS